MSAHADGPDAVAFWNRNYHLLEWDTDRRHQKARFGEATAGWAAAGTRRAAGWAAAAAHGWPAVWRYALGQPHMGRLSAWSMIEYARLLLPNIPDADGLLLHDREGSRSHRNGLAVIDGRDAAYWTAADVTPEHLHRLTALGADLLHEARRRNPGHADVGYLTIESALCTYKSWHKPRRRYPNVYADMGYLRLLRAQGRFGRRFDVLWQARREALPAGLRLEDTPHDPGVCAVKQNHYLDTGQVVMMDRDWPDLASTFTAAVARGDYGIRKDHRPWTPAP